MNVALWILQGLLGVLFVFSGAVKFFMPTGQMMKHNPLPLWFMYFIGVTEILGGIGLVLHGDGIDSHALCFVALKKLLEVARVGVEAELAHGSADHGVVAAYPSVPEHGRPL